MADAFVIPGRLYTADSPLLMFAGDAAERRGATVHRHSWSGRLPSPVKPEVEPWMCEQVAALLAPVTGTPLLIGKSLATNAASLAAERGLPAVWLTPLMINPWVVDALRRATAPFLLIGGTADRVWDGATARGLTPHILEVAGADHKMYVPGPLANSVAVLGRVVGVVEGFLDSIGWPAGTVDATVPG